MASFLNARLGIQVTWVEILPLELVGLAERPPGWRRVLIAPPLQIRPYELTDWSALWALLKPEFRAGETFPVTLTSQKQMPGCFGWNRAGLCWWPSTHRQSPLPALAAGSPVSGFSGDAVQPDVEHQHCRHPLLADQRVPDRRHPARGISTQATGLCGCRGDVSELGRGFSPVGVVPLRLMVSVRCSQQPSGVT